MSSVAGSRVPALVVGAYLLLLAVSVLLIFVGGDSLSGVFAVILTLPWSVMVTSLVESLVPDVSGTVSGTVGIVVGGAVNAGILYLVARLLSRRRAERGGQAGA